MKKSYFLFILLLLVTNIVFSFQEEIGFELSAIHDQSALESDIYRTNFLHNNYGDDAYFDNFKITRANLEIKHQELVNVKLYPNPTSDFVSFQLPQGQNIKEVAVYNITGKKLSVQNTNKVDLRSFPAGTYILKASLADSQSLIGKVIKK